MCRLFGLSSAPLRTHATFWLLDAPDSLSEQSRHDPDGTGLGLFGADGAPEVHKAPMAAYEDRVFAEEARTALSATFIAHVRFATTGGLTAANTHPFLQDGRLLAHNGVVEGLADLDAELGADRALVRGETDSERVFALITRETRARGGDVTAGIEHAVRWIAAHLPLFALNLVITAPREMWALRYPGTHDLFVLRRSPGGRHGNRYLHHCGTHGHLRVRSADLAACASVVVASERMDDNPDWRLMAPGELLHVAPGGAATSRVVLPHAPAHPLTLSDLHPKAAAAQRTR